MSFESPQFNQSEKEFGPGEGLSGVLEQEEVTTRNGIQYSILADRFGFEFQANPEARDEAETFKEFWKGYKKTNPDIIDRYNNDPVGTAEEVQVEFEKTLGKQAV